MQRRLCLALALGLAIGGGAEATQVTVPESLVPGCYRGSVEHSYTPDGGRIYARIEYTICGVVLGPPEDQRGQYGDWLRRVFQGKLGTGQLRLYGTVYTSSHYFDQNRKQEIDARVYVSSEGPARHPPVARQTFALPHGEHEQPFDVSVQIPPNVRVGSFYVVFAFGGMQLRVQCLDLRPGGAGPTVQLSYAPLNPTPSDTIVFTADASSPEGRALTYEWYLNGTQQTGVSATAHEMRWASFTPGTHTMRVAVSDGQGGTAEDSVTLTVGARRYAISPGRTDQGEWIAFVEQIFLDGREEPGVERTRLHREAAVKTGPGVEILLRYNTGAVVRVQENTQLDIVERRLVPAESRGSVLNRLREGIVNYFGRDVGLDEFEVETDRAVVGISGTEFTLRHVGNVTTLTVHQGSVEATDKASGRKTTVRAGQTATFDGATPESPTAAGFTVEASKRSVPRGGTVTVPVSLKNVDALANMNVDIHYDPAVVRPARDVAKGSFIPQALFEANARDRGVIRLGFAQSRDLTGTGTMAQLPFEAVGQPGARTALRLEVTMASPAAGGRVTPAQLIHGEIVIINPEGRVPGDTTGTGDLTALDAMNALKMSVRLLPEDLVADLDGDRQVTARDATLILQRVVGR
jgi:hypothetical protein